MHPESRADNPFAAPQPVRQPPQTWLSWSAMGSAFAVGGTAVEVVTSHWTGLEVYRVDGKEVRRKRNFGWHSVEHLEVGAHDVALISRWYPVLPVRVEVDGERRIDDLFPQIWPVKWTMFGLTGAAAGLLALSIAWDLGRLLLT